jgi:pimeloyl-ACP methyl ester carboxylesterase
MGLGAQLTQWPVELCRELVSRGYRVIRFDNRDVGLSSRMERDRALVWPDAVLALMQGKSAFVPYTLTDMAADAVGLLDALDIPRAHIVGASMGGMIAQHVAFDVPERTLSLTSIMSSSGNPLLPPAKPRVYSLFLSPAPAAHDTHAIVARGVKTYEVLGSPGFPTDRETLREWVIRDASRAYYPAGVMRQMAAVMADGDRRAKHRRAGQRGPWRGRPAGAGGGRARHGGEYSRRRDARRAGHGPRHADCARARHRGRHRRGGGARDGAAAASAASRAGASLQGARRLRRAA